MIGRLGHLHFAATCSTNKLPDLSARLKPTDGMAGSSSVTPSRSEQGVAGSWVHVGLARFGRIMRGYAAARTRTDVVPSERPTVLMVGEALSHENPGGLNRYLEDLASALEVAGTPVFTIRVGMGAHEISEPRSGWQDVFATAFADSVVLEGGRTAGQPYRCGRLTLRALRTASCLRNAPPFEALGRPLPWAVGRGVSGRGPAERRDSFGQALDRGRSLRTRCQTRRPLRGFQGHLGRALPRGSFSRGGDPPRCRPGPLLPG